MLLFHRLHWILLTTVLSLLLAPPLQCDGNNEHIVIAPRTISSGRSHSWFQSWLSMDFTRLINANDVPADVTPMLRSEVTEPSASPSTDTNHDDKKKGKHSRLIFGYTILGMFLFILTWSVWIFRKSIATCSRRFWIKFRRYGMQVIWRRRAQTQQGDGTLNDIIFDPEEDTASNITDSLLRSWIYRRWRPRDIHIQSGSYIK